jgi:hypothetical protein
MAARVSPFARQHTVPRDDEETLVRSVPGRQPPRLPLTSQALFSKMMRDLRVPVARFDPSAPLVIVQRPATNVFLAPPTAADAPPIWETAFAAAPRTARRPRPARARGRRRTALPWLVLAAAMALGFGLWRDPNARADVASTLAAANARAASVLFGY